VSWNRFVAVSASVSDAMPDSSKLPPDEDGCGFGYYVIVLILALVLLGGMLFLAAKPLWQ